jgi:hypothetical protein
MTAMGASKVHADEVETDVTMRLSSETGDLIPVLWLCGPPGVGKTTVGWEIFTQLTRDGIAAHRILLRGQGRGSWPQPGDPLLGQSAERLLQVSDQAAAAVDALERASVGAVSINTDRRTVQEVADAIVARTGWPGCLGFAPPPSTDSHPDFAPSLSRCYRKN